MVTVFGGFSFGTITEQAGFPGLLQEHTRSRLGLFAPCSLVRPVSPYRVAEVAARANARYSPV